MEFNGQSSTDYDECLLFASPDIDSEESPKIVGKYCRINMENLMPRDYVYQVDNVNETLVTLVQDIYMYDKERNPFKTDNSMRASKSVLVEFYRAIQWTKDINLAPGLCVPSLCSPNDIEILLNHGKFQLGD